MDGEAENRTHEWMQSILGSLDYSGQQIALVAQAVERIPAHNRGRARDYIVRLVRLGMNVYDAAHDAEEVYGNAKPE